jgi:hypothetical protein
MLCIQYYLPDLMSRIHIQGTKHTARAIEISTPLAYTSVYETPTKGTHNGRAQAAMSFRLGNVLSFVFRKRLYIRFSG